MPNDPYNLEEARRYEAIRQVKEFYANWHLEIMTKERRERAQEEETIKKAA